MLPGQPPVPAPAPVAQNAVAEVRPEYVGCVASKDKCSCMTSAGISISEPPMCRESAEGFGYLIKVAMTTHSAATGYVEPVHLVKQDADASNPSSGAVAQSRDGYGILGKAPAGLRQPGQ